ncbi:ribosome recycling factor [Gorillibacterium sp. CAU 1737]|uniref:ribosome recycling factor n=1 Tax=Gorillibacterium sp. CAU 1737 TaxID=3140362 RepID=UPI003260C314
MPASVKKNAEDRMEKAMAALKREMASLRAGRASASLLDRVQVEYYGSMTPLNQMAGVTTPDSRTLLIQPWDKSVIGAIEKAILKSELGLNPSNDGTVIRIVIPALTEERRAELAKMTRKYGEDAKVAVRNIRRDANDEVKKLEKTDGISEDETRRHQDDIQKLTDRYIVEVDKILAAKEKEIMEV